MKQALAILAAALFAFTALTQAEKDVDVLLSRMHEASKAADVTYFDLFADDAVFFGTDLWERWTKDEFAALYKPYMESGRGWEFKMRDRRVALQPCGTIALFDETLFSESYGPCRGSGAARLDDGEWTIVRYHLDITIPNEVVDQVIPITSAWHRTAIRYLHIDASGHALDEVAAAIRATKPDLISVVGLEFPAYHDLQEILLPEFEHCAFSDAPELLLLLRMSGFVGIDGTTFTGEGNKLTWITTETDEPAFLIADAGNGDSAGAKAEMDRIISEIKPELVFRNGVVEGGYEGVQIEIEPADVVGIRAIRGGIRWHREHEVLFKPGR